jgi:hypothetical protein
MWRRLETAAFILVLAGLLFAPLVQMARPFVKVRSLEERRDLHEVDRFWPRLLRLDPDLATDIGNWFNDHYGFRDLLIRIKNEFDYQVFGTSDKVLIGNDGWLFEDKFDEAWRKINARPAAPLVQAVRDFNSCLVRRGIRLVVVYNASKSTIYSDHLPSYAPRAPADGLAQRVAAALEHEPGLLFVNGERVLRPHRREIVFYRTDPHMTGKGAQLVYGELIARMASAWGIAPPPTPRLEPIAGHLTEGSEQRFLAKFFPLVEAADDFGETGKLFKDDANGRWIVNTVREFGEAPSAAFDFIFINRRKNVPLLPTTVLLGASTTDRFFSLGFNEAFQAIYRTKNNTFERILPVMNNLPAGTKFMILEYPEQFTVNLEFLPLATKTCNAALTADAQ